MYYREKIEINLQKVTLAIAEINDYDFDADKKRKLKLEILSKIKKEIIIKAINLI